MSPSGLRDAVRARARDVGFDAIGWCSAETPPEASIFEDWIRRGLHGSMSYLVAHAGERLDPARLLPGVRTILVGAVRYGPQEPPSSPAGAGEVSCYAWGSDYHVVVGEKAAALAAFLRDALGARAEAFVDTGPVLERMWAAKAGVGWIGKNSLILNRDLGSYVFLAVVLTDLDLEPDPPAIGECGSCTLCLEACPTGAIVEPGIVDSRLCLSYHTIEMRGSFPAAHREALGARVFGCDDCQSVCPWNRSGPAPPDPFLPREENARPDLPRLLSMPLAEYTERFRGTAMKRATYQGLRRNAAVALGNLLAGRGAAPPERPATPREDAARALAALTAAASDPEPSVAEAASWALAESGRPQRP